MMEDWAEKWVQNVLDRDKREHPNETEHQRSQRRKAELAQEKHDKIQRQSRRKQSDDAKKFASYARYMETMVESVRKLEQMKELAARRDEAWLDKERIRANAIGVGPGRNRAFWPQELESAFEERHGADAVENLGVGRPVGFTEWQQSELGRRKRELSRMSREYQKYQNQFRLPVIPRDE